MATCLAAHAVPEDAESADAYITLCIDEILPDIAEWGLAEAVDVFCERARSTSSRRGAISRPARDHGLALRLHGDQFAEIGALDLAIELGARSIDHLEATGDEGHRQAGRLRRRRRRAADRRADARAPAAARPRARRRRRPARARDRLQSRLEPLRLAARGHAPGLHAVPPLARRGALGRHRERRARARHRRSRRDACASASAPISRCSTCQTGATSPTGWAARASST